MCPIGSERARAAASCNPKSQVRILLADDEPQVRNLIVRVLSRQGWEVVAAANGNEAVAAWPVHGAGFDLVILDVNMPGLSGYEAYLKLVEIHPEALFLFASGYAEQDVWYQMVEKRGLPTIAKPFSPSDLVAKVRALLNQECFKSLAAGKT